MEHIGVQTNSSSTLAGVVAPKTETQAAEQAAQRIIKTDNTSLTNQDRDQDTARFSAVQEAAKRFAQDKQEDDLPPRRFTIYKDNSSYMYVTRFTDLATGRVEIMREWELVEQQNGSILNGLA